MHVSNYNTKRILLRDFSFQFVHFPVPEFLWGVGWGVVQRVEHLPSIYDTLDLILKTIKIYFFCLILGSVSLCSYFHFVHVLAP
jgi:hypothetical protein